MKYYDQIQYYAEKFIETNDSYYFGEIYKNTYLYYKRIGHKYYFLNSANVEEILSSFYLRIYECFDQYKPARGMFLNWTSRIFSNVIYKYFRHYDKIKYFWTIKDITFYDEDFEFIKQEEEEVLKDKLNTFLNKVPEPYQTLLKEKYYDGMSGKEIANKYNVSVQIIKNGLFRGRFFLKNLMKDPDFKTPQGVEKNNYLLVAMNKYNKENEQ